MRITDRVSGKEVQVRFFRTDPTGRWSPLRTRRTWFTWDTIALVAAFIMACGMGVMIALGM